MIRKAEKNNLSDEELLLRYRQSGNKDYLGQLLQRYTFLLLGVCYKYLKNEEDSRDAVQQVFIKTIIEADKNPIRHFKSWLYIVARNHCFMLLRNPKRHLPEEVLDTQDQKQFPDPFQSIQEAVEKDQLLAWLEEGLNSLPPTQKQCLTLFYLEKKSYLQISQNTGYTPLQVKSYIQNGKRNLRIWLDKMKINHET